MDDDEEVLKYYWAWKIKTIKGESRKEALRKAGAVVDDQMWTTDHLKRMSDTSSSVYKMAITLRLADGLVTSFIEDFHNFKSVYRDELIPTRNLAAMRGEGFVQDE